MPRPKKNNGANPQTPKEVRELQKQLDEVSEELGDLRLDHYGLACRNESIVRLNSDLTIDNEVQARTIRDLSTEITTLRKKLDSVQSFLSAHVNQIEMIDAILNTEA